jgi:hypothetical protein
MGEDINCSIACGASFQNMANTRGAFDYDANLPRVPALSLSNSPRNL